MAASGQWVYGVGAPEALHAPGALAVCRALFTCAYGVARPVVAPRRVVHWQAQQQALEQMAGAALALPWCAAPTLVAGGYFYNVSTPPPGAAEVAAMLEEAQAAGVEQVLVPTVPRGADTAALEQAGFRRVPGLIEAWVEPGPGDVETALREILGGHGYREWCRLQRRADAVSRVDVLEAGALLREPGLVSEVERLHALNLARHGLTVNIFSAPVIRALAASALGPALRVLLRRDLEGRAVQMMAVLAPPGGEAWYCLVQGIDHAAVPLSQNFYRATVLDCLRAARAAGARRVYLGRGGAAAKRRLGANRFRLLDYWLRVPAACAAGIERVAALSARWAAGQAGQAGLEPPAE